MKTHFLRQFPTTAREQIDAILASSAATRTDCHETIADVRAMAADVCGRLKPFLDPRLEGRPDDDTTIGANARREIAIFCASIREIHDRLAALPVPLVTALEAQVAKQRAIEENLCKATDDFLGLPAPVDEDERSDIAAVALHLVKQSAGDGDLTEAGRANHATALENITASRARGGAAA